MVCHDFFRYIRRLVGEVWTKTTVHSVLTYFLWILSESYTIMMTAMCGHQGKETCELLYTDL